MEISDEVEAKNIVNSIRNDFPTYDFNCVGGIDNFKIIERDNTAKYVTRIDKTKIDWEPEIGLIIKWRSTTIHGLYLLEVILKIKYSLKNCDFFTMTTAPILEDFVSDIVARYRCKRCGKRVRPLYLKGGLCKGCRIELGLDPPPKPKKYRRRSPRNGGQKPHSIFWGIINIDS